MHVCGTHQDTLMKHGLDSLLSSCGIDILQGPGCPVCVTTQKEIEEMLLLAKNGKIVTSFGDMMKVPGEKDSLNSIKADGFDVRTVYGIEDAVKMPCTRSRTKRPRGALLQLDTGLGFSLCRIGGRQRSQGASLGGAAGEIPPWLNLGSNSRP